MINYFKNKKVAVLGMGVEGVSSVKFLVKKGARVTVLDKKKGRELEEEIKKLRNKDIKIITGKNYLENLSGFDIIVRSPGVKRNLPEIINAEKKGVVVSSQTKIFFDLCPCPIIGVTGTKGKGTTATLIYEMLKKQGLDAYLGGNIGNPPFEFLDRLRKGFWVVLELSSFQLQDLTKSPHIAVILMITSEHLDYHKDIYEYIEAKRNILRSQKATDFAIINKDYLASRASDVLTQGKLFEVSREGEVREGCFAREGKVIVRLKNARAPRAPTDEIIIDVKDILLPGKHNLENVCAAVIAALSAGVSKENIRKVLKTFKGLEHRLELVGEVNGVRYYDDSFSTTPETAIAAIRAFTQPEILILGGSSKRSDFTGLGRVIGGAKNIKAIIGVGVEWKRIKEELKVASGKLKIGKLKIIEGLKNMKEIVESAAKMAQVGDVVLLSPACASFDMFKNYKDRGEQFEKHVLNLKNQSIK